MGGGRGLGVHPAVHHGLIERERVTSECTMSARGGTGCIQDLIDSKFDTGTFKLGQDCQAEFISKVNENQNT